MAEEGRFSHTLPEEAYPYWYSPETGIYQSKQVAMDLPTDPFTDVVSFIFSHQHNGVSALIDSSSDFSISYSKLFPLVKSVASGLLKMGISKGDVVLLLIPNSIYYPVVFLGVLYSGAVVTPLNPISSFSEIRKQIVDCGVSLAFTVPHNVNKLKSLGIPVIEVPENVKDLNHVAFSVFQNLVSGSFDLPMRPAIRQEDTAAIMYSSGTTGASKGAVLSHKNLMSAVQHFVRFEASQYSYPSVDNVYLDILPMYHIYGLVLFSTGLLSLGCTVILMKKFDIDEVIKAIDKYKVTHFPCVPPMMIALTKKAKSIKGSSLQSLKQVSCGAATVSRNIIDDFRQTLPTVDFIQGYGMTETTAVGTRGFNTEKFRKYTSIGLLAPNLEAKVVDPQTGALMPPGSIGELWLRGPGIMEGYLNNEDATRSAIDKEGWLRTGDVIHFDLDGYLHMSDRLKDIIKYKGFQIAPADLEAVLITHPEIVDVAVTSALDEETGEIPVAFVVRKDGSVLSEAAVMDYVAKQVAPYRKIRKVFFTDSIPRSATGKILRRLLRNNLVSKL